MSSCLFLIMMSFFTYSILCFKFFHKSLFIRFCKEGALNSPGSEFMADRQSINHRITEHQVGRVLQDHLVWPFLANQPTTNPAKHYLIFLLSKLEILISVSWHNSRLCNYNPDPGWVIINHILKAMSLISFESNTATLFSVINTPCDPTLLQGWLPPTAVWGYLKNPTLLSVHSKWEEPAKVTNSINAKGLYFWNMLLLLSTTTYFDT